MRDESVQDVERVSEVENGGWTAEVLGEFLSRLSQEGWTAQEHAIRMAALRGGFVEREIVYSLGGYAEGRSLRGFTRPINRIAREFRAQGIIPESAIDILVTEYDPKPDLPAGQTSGFRVPEVLVPLIRELAKDRQARAALMPNLNHVAAALSNFRKYGHDVEEDTWEHDDNHGWSGIAVVAEVMRSQTTQERRGFQPQGWSGAVGPESLWSSRVTGCVTTGARRVNQG